MKRTLFLASLLSLGLLVGALGQNNQSPTMQQSTSTEETRRNSQVRPKIKRTTRQERAQLETGLDTTLPKKPTRSDRKQRRLRPDSLRRGGATRVDTVR